MCKDNALVSIIVPVYNTAEYVEECILSILSQSYENIELILVNDGSTDGAGDICRHFEKEPNVMLVEQENSGVQMARKHGVERASGEWIMFVDSDDYIAKDCIQNLYDHTDKVDIVVSTLFGGKNLKSFPVYLEKEEYLRNLYFRRVAEGPVAKLFRRELFNKCSTAFDYHIPYGEDFIMNLALAQFNVKSVAVCKTPVYFYRRRNNSAIHSFSFDLDYCASFCNILDSMVAVELSEKDLNYGKILNRMTLYMQFLNLHRLQGNKHHPLVKDLIPIMNKERMIRISDRLILSVSDRRAMRFCFFLNKFIRRIEQPSIVINDLKRLLWT